MLIGLSSEAPDALGGLILFSMPRIRGSWSVGEGVLVVTGGVSSVLVVVYVMTIDTVFEGITGLPK
jgi:hypothetical protein